MIHINPCKLCGGRGHILNYRSDGSTLYYCECMVCYNTTGSSLVKDNAIYNWDNNVQEGQISGCETEDTIKSNIG